MPVLVQLVSQTRLFKQDIFLTIQKEFYKIIYILIVQNVPNIVINTINIWYWNVIIFNTEKSTQKSQY